MNNEIDQIIYDNATLDDFLHKYDEYSYTNFADLVSPKPERQGEYLNKQIIIENYNEGVLKDKHIIDEILKNKASAFEIYKKYNLRRLREILLKRRKFLIFNFLTKTVSINSSGLREAMDWSKFNTI